LQKSASFAYGFAICQDVIAGQPTTHGVLARDCLAVAVDSVIRHADLAGV